MSVPGLNLGALKALQEDLGSKDDFNFYQNKLTAETDVRLLPPLPHMNGIYFHEEKVFWINKKVYTCPSTFGLKSVLQDEYETALEKAKTDKQLDALLKDWQKFKPETRYKIPFLLLACKFDASNNPAEVKVSGDKAKTLILKSDLLKAINKEVTSRQNQNGTPFGLMDREKGFNLILGKTGEKKDTVYTAVAWKTSYEMDEKYYKNIPDVVELSKKSIKSDAYLRSVIRNFFYGEALIEDDSKNQTSAPAADNSNAGTATANSSRTAAPVEEATSSSRTSAPAVEVAKEEVKVTPAGGKTLMSSLNALQDD